MKISIGSRAQNKIDAVKEIFWESEDFSGAAFEGVSVDSNVSDQPLTLDETMQGAMNRARNAFVHSDYSVGIESGFLPIPNTKTGYMNITVCAIYDGTQFHFGISSAFEAPKEVTRLCIEEKLDLSRAYKKAGLTENDYVGHAEGSIGHLTKNRLLRKDYTKEAVRCAFIHIENPELY